MSWGSFIIGLLIGWIAEWVIDWMYWRRRTADGSAEAENLRTQNKRLRADLDAAAKPVEQLKADAASANSKLAAAQADADSLRAELAELRDKNMSAPVAQADHSAEINRLRARLNVDSGAAAFLSDQLTMAREERNAVQSENERLQAHIHDAASKGAPSGNQFATQQLSSAEVQAALELEQLRADNARMRAQLDANTNAASSAGSQYKTQLMNVADLNLAQGARADGAGDDTARLRGDLESANSQIVQLRAELDGLRGRPVRDALIDINGIGPVIEKRMFEAGIFTFAQLAAETPERLREIARLKEWQDADPAHWIAEARERAAQKSGS